MVIKTTNAVVGGGGVVTVVIEVWVIGVVFVLALGPRRDTAAASYARAASSAESNVPSHTRAFFIGSLISAANLPHGLFLTPRYRGSTGGTNSIAAMAAESDEEIGKKRDPDSETRKRFDLGTQERKMGACNYKRRITKDGFYEEIGRERGRPRLGKEKRCGFGTERNIIESES
ncbi:hypothetical protein Lal_00036067 [Lupinus albus]|nr:hypothetical protein Lal_00036067 [Lupinus albus]